MKRVGSVPHLKDSPVIPFLSRINPIPHIDTHFFKVHYNIVPQFTPRPPFRFASSCEKLPTKNSIILDNEIYA